MDNESSEIDEIARQLHNISGSVMGLSGRNANELSRQCKPMSRQARFGFWMRFKSVILFQGCIWTMLHLAPKSIAKKLRRRWWQMDSPMPMMCERDGCAQPAVYDCEAIPGTAETGWESEPTARCEEHSKGLLIIQRVIDVSKD